MISSIVNCIALENGFTKKGRAWYRKCEKGWMVVHLQKSQFSNDWYINLCIWFDFVGGTSNFPKHNKCHIQARLHPPTKGSQAWSIDSESEAESADALRLALQKEAIPWLERHSTLQGVRESISRGGLAYDLVYKEVRNAAMSLDQ